MSISFMIIRFCRALATEQIFFRFFLSIVDKERMAKIQVSSGNQRQGTTWKA